MARPQTEFYDTASIPWQHVEGYPEGVTEKVLSKDPDTGSLTRLVTFEPGVIITETRIHNYYEEVYVVKGGLIDLGQNLDITEGSYCYRHPGMKHGPYSTPTGCILFETITYL